jgi:hypothetical protein
VDELLDPYAVHIAPQEVFISARIHPPPGQDGDWLGEDLDDLDVRLRRELPEVGEVFIDVTAHHLRRHVQSSALMSKPGCAGHAVT